MDAREGAGLESRSCLLDDDDDDEVGGRQWYDAISYDLTQ